MNTQVIETKQIDSGHGVETVELGEKSGLLGKIKSIYVGYREWARYRAAIRELSMMDDARLADIGIVRGEIRTVVRQTLNKHQSRENRSVAIKG